MSEQLYTVCNMAEAKLRERDNLSGALLLSLRNMIVDGSLPAGERINEVHLAEQLGVSRTPLREALAKLYREGALTSLPRIGWFVLPLTLEEFEQVYALRPLLDPEALRLAGLPPPERLTRLRRLNARLRTAPPADTAIALDDEWHLLLIDACPNRVLIDMIKDIIRRTRRYELALMREGRHVAAATAEHEAVMDALAEGELDTACALLRKNLTTGFAPIAAWLREREGR